MSSAPNNPKSSGGKGFRPDGSAYVLAVVILLFLVAGTAAAVRFSTMFNGQSNSSEQVTTTKIIDADSGSYSPPTPSPDPSPDPSPTMPPLPSSLDANALSGIWYGTFEGLPATLEVTPGGDKAFTAILTETSADGTFHIQTEGTVDTEGQVVLTETKVIDGPEGHSWSLCVDRGTVQRTTEGISWMGKGQDEQNTAASASPTVYRWQFSSNKPGHAVESLAKVKFEETGALSSQEITDLRQAVADIARQYDSRAEAYKTGDVESYFSYAAPDWEWSSESNDTSTLTQSKEYYANIFRARSLAPSSSDMLETGLMQAARVGDAVVVSVAIASIQDSKPKAIAQIDTWRETEQGWRCYKEKRILKPEDL